MSDRRTCEPELGGGSTWRYSPHLHHSLLDWCCMGLIALAFATPALVARVRHGLWRRRVLSAMR